MGVTPNLPVLRGAMVMGLVAIGALIGAIMATRAEADLNRSDMDGYSYDGSEWRCVDWRQWKDPFTIAFVHGATPQLVERHAHDHGYGHDDDDDEQRFYDNGYCGFEHTDTANHAEFPLRDRFHMRTRMGTSPWLYDVDPTWGIFSVATPHRDNAAVCGHYVPENYQGTGYSGFVAGRIDVIERWVTFGEHISPDYENWYNTARIEQCNGERPKSDGYVWYIQMSDTDNDGCVDGEELPGAPAPKPGATGSYDPLQWYDFYDVPVPANPDPTPNGPKNKAINMGDVLVVLFYVGTYDGDGGIPNSNGVAYDSVKGSCDWNADTVPDKEGRCCDRSPGPAPSPPWDAGPPSGAVAMNDVLAVLPQTGLSCADPPNAAGGSSAGEGGTLSSGPNAMAVDAISGGSVDPIRVRTDMEPFDIDILITVADDPYAGYNLALSYDDQILEFVPTEDIDSDTVPESWTYTGLAGMVLDASVSTSDVDGDTVRDKAVGGSARGSGTASATGAVVTARFRCVGNGIGTLHLVPPSESELATTTLAAGGAAIGTTLTDATVWCRGVE